MIVQDKDVEQATRTLSIAALIILCTITLPVYLTALHAVYKYSDHEFLRVRGARSLATVYIVSGINAFICIPVAVSSIAFNFLFSSIILNMAIITSSILVFFVVAMFHLAGFFIKIKKAEAMAEWHTLLDPNYTYKNCIVKYLSSNKQRVIYGTILSILIIIPFFIIFILNVSSIGIMSSGTAVLYITIMANVFALSLTIVFFIIARAVVLFNDKYYLNKECKYLMISSCITGILGTGTLFLTHNIEFIAVYACTDMIIIYTYCWIFTVLYPVYIIRKKLQTKKSKSKKHITNAKTKTNTKTNTNTSIDNSQPPKHLHLHSATYSHSHSHSPGSPGSPKSPESPSHGKKFFHDKKDLVDILCNAAGFESFIQHLVSEFATENLLFIVYLIQFQMFLIEINFLPQNNDQDVTSKRLYFIQREWNLPQNVPQSVVFKPKKEKINLKSKNGDNENIVAVIPPTEEWQDYTEQMINIFVIIFEKFIDNGRAPLEINVSDRTRAAASVHYNNLSSSYSNTGPRLTGKQELLGMWQSLRTAGIECWRLLSFSLSRYHPSEP